MRKLKMMPKNDLATKSNVAEDTLERDTVGEEFSDIVEKYQKLNKKVEAAIVKIKNKKNQKSKPCKN